MMIMVEGQLAKVSQVDVMAAASHEDGAKNWNSMSENIVANPPNDIIINELEKAMGMDNDG